MKKAHSFLSILILFILIAFQNNPANCQWFGNILSTNISPAIISTNDTITVNVWCEFPSGSCQVEELTVTQFSNSFEANAYHCLGWLQFICGAVDIIEIPPQAPGDYQLNFQLFSGNWYNGFCFYYNFADFVTIPFTVHPFPAVVCPGDFSVCFNDSSIILDGAVPSGGVYYGQGVSEGRFYPGLAGDGNHEITYYYTDPDTGISNSCTFTITVLPLIVVEAPDDIVANSDDSAFILTGGIPAGGIYTGNGVYYNSGNYFFDPSSTGAGAYIIEYCSTDAATGYTNCDQFLVIVDPGYIVGIPAGWSGISSYILPVDTVISNLFHPISGKLIILCTLDGFYLPGQGINNLITWDNHSGYMIKVNEPANLPFFGDEVQDKTVYLDEGWSIIPVLCQSAIPVENLFIGIPGFQLVKEVAGPGVYWKTFGINTIGNLHPGKAYFVYTTSAGTINFSAKSGNLNIEKPVELLNISPWNKVHHTPTTHIVALTKQAVQTFNPGDIIGAFTSRELCAGIVEYQGRETALSLNGDDGLTEARDGFGEGENISYKLYRPSTLEIFDMEVEYKTRFDNSGQFHSNGMSAISGLTLTGFETLSGLEGSDIRIYPNPSAGIFNIEGIDGEAEITIFNAFGEEIIDMKIILPDKVDLSAQATGIYFIRICSEEGTWYNKLIVE